MGGRKFVVLRLVVGLLLAGSTASAFECSLHGVRTQNSRLPTAIYALGRKQEEDKKKRTLNFKSSFAADSELVPASSTENALAFFQDHGHLSFDDSMPSSRVPLTPDLFEKWKQACLSVGASIPDVERDNILSVRTAGVSIPGLKVEYSFIIGSKLVQHPDTRLPAFEFVLIKDETTARGIRPILWIFKKITDSKRGQRRTGTKFFSRVAIRQSDDDKKAFFFSCDGTMDMNFRVPSVLVRVLGRDKEKSEKRMSKVITEQIEKDMVRSLARWQERYKSWVSNCDAATTTALLENSL